MKTPGMNTPCSLIVCGALFLCSPALAADAALTDLAQGINAWSARAGPDATPRSPPVHRTSPLWPLRWDETY